MVGCVDGLKNGAWVRNMVNTRSSCRGFKKFVVTGYTDAPIATYMNTAEYYAEYSRSSFRSSFKSILTTYAWHFQYLWHLGSPRESDTEKCISAMCGKGKGCPKSMKKSSYDGSAIRSLVNEISECAETRKFIIIGYTDAPIATYFNSGRYYAKYAKDSFRSSVSALMTSYAWHFQNLWQIGTPKSEDTESFLQECEAEMGVEEPIPATTTAQPTTAAGSTAATSGSSGASSAPSKASTASGASSSSGATSAGSTASTTELVTLSTPASIASETVMTTEWLGDFVSSHPSCAGFKQYLIKGKTDVQIASFAATSHYFAKFSRSNFKKQFRSLMSSYSWHFKNIWNIGEPAPADIDTCVDAMCGKGKGCPKSLKKESYMIVVAITMCGCLEKSGDITTLIGGIPECGKMKKFVIKGYTDSSIATYFTKGRHYAKYAKDFFRIKVRNFLVSFRVQFTTLNLVFPSEAIIEAFLGACEGQLGVEEPEENFPPPTACPPGYILAPSSATTASGASSGSGASSASGGTTAAGSSGSTTSPGAASSASGGSGSSSAGGTGTTAAASGGTSAASGSTAALGSSTAASGSSASPGSSAVASSASGSTAGSTSAGASQTTTPPSGSSGASSAASKASTLSGASSAGGGSTTASGGASSASGGSTSAGGSSAAGGTGTTGAASGKTTAAGGGATNPNCVPMTTAASGATTGASQGSTAAGGASGSASTSGASGSASTSGANGNSGSTAGSGGSSAAATTQPST